MSGKPFGAKYIPLVSPEITQPDDLKGSGLHEVKILACGIANTVCDDEEMLAYIFDDLGFRLHQMNPLARENFRAVFLRNLQGFGNLGFEAVDFLFDRKAMRAALKDQAVVADFSQTGDRV